MSNFILLTLTYISLINYSYSMYISDDKFIRPLDAPDESLANIHNTNNNNNNHHHSHHNHHHNNGKNDDDLEAAYASSRGSRIQSANDYEEENFKPIDPYTYGYEVKDDFGNRHFRQEESDGQGTIRGSYGYTDANGLYRIVEYIADAKGFRAKVKTNEPGVKNQSSASIDLSASNPPEEIIRAASEPILRLQKSASSSSTSASKLISSSSSASYSLHEPPKKELKSDAIESTLSSLDLSS